ncbi:hypothetical protein DM860_009216 [Cuscuta australis]|uniref:Uncharacterized protein n=1 Tax=Cuscuta australis TaxID=267555 RepID=A0A328DEU0_9ASTE|nr:hypothetical protein DM860_009216 [Cuscuta australis]
MQTTNQILRKRKRATQLNDLGNDVLSHILSFLTLEEAMQTSILCKRWQYIWLPHPFLKLKQKRVHSSYGFLKFIQRILTLRGSSKLIKFKLKSQTNSSSLIESLISAAVKCEVEECELHLKANMKDPIFFPHMLHNSSTLTYLEIKMTYQVRLIVHPSMCTLPNLKILKLRRVTFFEQQPTKSLFSGCLALEELRLQHCLWEGVTTVTIPSSNLHTLVIEEPLCDFSYDPKIANKFIIGGDRLKVLDYRGRLFFEYNLLNNKLLEDSSIMHCPLWDEYQELIQSRYHKLLSQAKHISQRTDGGYGLIPRRKCRYCE